MVFGIYGIFVTCSISIIRKKVNFSQLYCRPVSGKVLKDVLNLLSFTFCTSFVVAMYERC